MTNKKVLVGEGNYAEFEILNDFLSNRGFDVSWVKNGHDAIAHFEEVKYDLVILDALLSGIAGLKVCQKIREMEGVDNVKTILLSSVYKQFKEKYDNRKTLGVDAYAEKPVEIASLDKLISKLLEDDKNEQSNQTTSVEMEIISSDNKKLGPKGAFESTPFPKILFYLKKYNRTGALEVEHELINKVVYVSQGKLAFVSSNQSSESLGRFMVKAGILSVNDYNSSLEKMLEAGNQQGRVLLDMNVVTPHQLYEALQGHLMEKILAVFSWEAGKFSFKSGRLKLDKALTIELDLMDVIQKGISIFYPLSRLETFFNEYKNQRIFRIADSMYEKKELILKPSHANFIKSIDSKMTLGQIVSRTKMSLTETFQLLYFLLLIEEIRFEGDSALGERSISEQTEYIKTRKNWRKNFRESALETEMAGQDKVARFRDKASFLFNKLGNLNHFDLLKVTVDATKSEIKTAYFQMVQDYHPSEIYSLSDDITKAKADGIFKAITLAYEVLAAPRSRENYIKSLEKRQEMGFQSEELPKSDEEMVGGKAAPVIEDVNEASDFDALPDFDDDEIFSEKAITDDTTQMKAERETDLDVDTEISWGSPTEEFNQDSEDDLELDFSFDMPDSTEEDLQVEQGRKVTMDMAAVIKSELEFQQGEDMLQDGFFDEAALRFQKAIEINSNEAEYHAMFGWALFKSKPKDKRTIEDAFRSLENSLSINPNLDSAHYYLGQLFSAQDNGEKARYHFEKAIQFNPQNEAAQKALEELER